MQIQPVISTTGGGISTRDALAKLRTPVITPKVRAAIQAYLAAQRSIDLQSLLQQVNTL